MSNKDFKYELFFDLSPDLLCIAGYDGFFKKVNPAVSKILGYSLEELYARPIREFIYEADRELTAKVRTELINAKPLLNFENRYVTKSGEIVWLSWTSLPVESDELIFAIAKDITHKKKLEEERNEHLASLTILNKELRSLTYTSSHDLRSPVNNLLSVFNLLDTSKISDQETLELIDIIRQTGDSLKDTLSKYVDILSNKFAAQANLEEVNFDYSFASVCNSINSLIKTSQTSISNNFSQLESVRFNKAYLESIFLNLLTNAIKYKKPESQPIINVYSQKANGKPQLIFEDKGLGFDMNKVKDKIFGLHEQFHYHADSKGIGLYLVHHHITSLGGQVHVESKPNEGAKFTITFKAS